jgi:hypothetical protein
MKNTDLDGVPILLALSKCDKEMKIDGEQWNRIVADVEDNRKYFTHMRMSGVTGYGRTNRAFTIE